MTSKKIIIPGGSGFLGEVLAKYFKAPVYEVVILSRNPKLFSAHARYVKWDGKHEGAWKEEFENAFAVINLTGRSVNCRYNDQNKKEILASRIDATNIVGKVIQQCLHPPETWINAASATIYRHAEDREMDEATGEIGKGFSVNVCMAWEKAFNDVQTPRTRKIALRMAMVLGDYRNSVWPVLKRLTRFGMGGKMGNGKQFISWIHETDYARAIDFLLNHAEISGTLNVAAPHPLPNSQFMKMLRDEMHIPFGLPATEWMLEAGAFFIGTETELVLKSRRVVPRKLLEAGFQFKFPELKEAIWNLNNYKL
ncbi:MAG TPA: TIGR01777 family oxidoreductase [Chitinophagales bacterium]|nr:TIGR01777 family oxidoreductase [Chitinophagales bacterium]